MGMESSTRSKSSLGKRSIVARLFAVLALVACGVAIYLLVTTFTEKNGEEDGGRDRKNRSEQAKDREAAASYSAALR